MKAAGFTVCGELCIGRTPDGDKAGIPVFQFGKIAKLLHIACTNRASDFLCRSKHKVINDQLMGAIKEISEGHIAIRALKAVVFLHLYHRKPPAKRIDAILLLRQPLLFGEEGGTSIIKCCAVDNRRMWDGFVFHSESILQLCLQGTQRRQSG